MITLYQHPFCPHSRFVRLALGEHGLEPNLIEERVWERRREFLLFCPEGATPVMIEDDGPSSAAPMWLRNISTRRSASTSPTVG